MQDSKRLRAYFDELRDPEPNANGLAVVTAELLLDIRELLTERLPAPISEDATQGDDNPEEGETDGGG